MKPPSTTDSHEPGDWVEDSESEDSRALVVDVFEGPASAWGIFSLGKTVHEENPDYPASDRVVRVVFADAIQRKHPDLDTDDLVGREKRPNGRLEGTALTAEQRGGPPL